MDGKPQGARVGKKGSLPHVGIGRLRMEVNMIGLEGFGIV